MAADAGADGIEGAFCGLAQQVFELGEDLLDRIEVWGVFWQEEEFGAGGTDGAADGLALVAAEVIQNDDIAGSQGGNENRLDVEPEPFTVDRTIDEPRGIDAVATQCRQEGHRLPATVRNFGVQPHPARRPSAQRCHVGLGPGLIDEDEALRLDATLILDPLRPPPRHVGPVALASHQAFF